MGSEEDPAIEIRAQTQRPRQAIQELSSNVKSTYVPIRPKPVTNRYLSHRNVSRHIKRFERARESRHGVQERCDIAQCLIPNCRLRTHRRSLDRPDKDPYTGESFTQDIGKSNADPKVAVQAMDLLPQGGVEWFPNLPFERSEEPEFRKLFHHFVVTLYDTIDALIRPPRFTESERRRQANFKQWNFEMAISDPIYSLNFIAAAQIQLGSKRVSHGAEQTTAKLHNLVMKSLRVRLEKSRPEKMREVISIIMTLAILDMAAGRYDTLSLHRNALKHVVAASGGYHNLGNFIYYAENLDHMLSNVTGLPPLFSSMPARGIERPLRRPQVYGAAFDSKSMIDDLDEDVLYYCFGICRAIEILEVNDLDFTPENRRLLGTANTELHYFWFLRSHLHVLYCHVQPRESFQNPKSRFILLATKIVDYMVLMNNYLASIPARVAEKLQRLLECEDLEQNWVGWQDVLIWIFFALNMVEDRKDDKAWRLKSLILLLNKRYGTSNWPLNWRKRELRKLRTFAWSHKRLDRHFHTICDTVERITQEITD